MFSLGILILLPFLIYTLARSDVRHIIAGTDGCGNFCGYENSKVEGIECSGVDYTAKPFESEGKCVSTCPSEQISVDGVCLQQGQGSFYISGSLPDDNDVKDFEDFQEGFKYSGKVWNKYLLSVVMTLALSIFTLMVLRFLPGVVVWGVTYFCIILLIMTTGLVWYEYASSTSDRGLYRRKNHSSLAVAVLWTTITSILLAIFKVVYRKIGLVVQLYKEAAKALGDMPFLVLLPVPTALIQITVWISFAILTVSMLFARELHKTELPSKEYRYEMNGVMVFAIVITLFFAGWTLRSIHGLYYMTVSGSVGTWFFSRNKDNLGSPIRAGFANAVKYHLGTALFGSFLLTLFSVVKAFMKLIFRNSTCKCLTACTCTWAEVLFHFLSENAYTETALHGQSYIRSAKRATKLLLENAKSLIAVTCVGDFVLGVIILIITLISSVVSFALFYDLGVAAVLPILICSIVNFIIVGAAFSTFHNIIEALFICFCEDSVLNDGMSRPYFMSRGLMEFVEHSKKLYPNQF